MMKQSPENHKDVKAMFSNVFKRLPSLAALIGILTIGIGCSSSTSDPGNTNPPPSGAGVMIVKVLDYAESPVVGAVIAIQGTDYTTGADGMVSYTAKTIPEYVEVKARLSGWTFTPDSLKNLIESNDKDTIILHGERPTDPLFIDLVTVPPGSFVMGSDSSFDNSKKSKPSYPATITYSYLISKYEVTERLWREVMGADSKSTGCDNCPVIAVTFFDAARFCNALSVRKGLQPAYTINGDDVQWDIAATGYRLPTECEWEWAAKGNLNSAWYLGNFGEWDKLYQISWCEDNSGGTKHEVGQLLPNERGMYDVIGNAYEWAWDYYGDNTADPKTDYRGPDSGKYRVVKGASFVTSRIGHFLCKRLPWTQKLDEPGGPSTALGFRLCRSKK